MLKEQLLILDVLLDKVQPKTGTDAHLHWQQLMNVYHDDFKKSIGYSIDNKELNS